MAAIVYAPIYREYRPDRKADSHTEWLR
jgi:hypothetical protein